MSAYESKEAMEKVLLKMAELMETDEALLEGIKGKNISVNYKISDLDLVFYNKFMDGKVEAGIGELPGADMQLKMTSDILDGMYTGKLNSVAAAMKGDIIWSGNMQAGMRMQPLQGDFMRLYHLAKASV